MEESGFKMKNPFEVLLEEISDKLTRFFHQHSVQDDAESIDISTISEDEDSDQLTLTEQVSEILKKTSEKNISDTIAKLQENITNIFLQQDIYPEVVKEILVNNEHIIKEIAQQQNAADKEQLIKEFVSVLNKNVQNKSVNSTNNNFTKNEFENIDNYLQIINPEAQQLEEKNFYINRFADKSYFVTNNNIINNTNNTLLNTVQEQNAVNKHDVINNLSVQQPKGDKLNNIEKQLIDIAPNSRVPTSNKTSQPSYMNTMSNMQNSFSETPKSTYSSNRSPVSVPKTSSNVDKSVHGGFENFLPYYNGNELY